MTDAEFHQRLRVLLQDPVRRTAIVSTVDNYLRRSIRTLADKDTLFDTLTYILKPRVEDESI